VLVSSVRKVSFASIFIVMISCVNNDRIPHLERFLMPYLLVEQLLNIYVLFIQCSPNTCTLPTYSNRKFLTFNVPFSTKGCENVCFIFGFEVIDFQLYDSQPSFSWFRLCSCTSNEASLWDAEDFRIHIFIQQKLFLFFFQKENKI